MNSMELAWATLSTPSAAFKELRERPRFALPLALTLIGTMIVLAWYYSFVDFEWLRDHLLNANQRMRQMSEQQRERAMAGMSRTVILWSSVIGAAVFTLVIHLISAAYYSLAGKITNVQYTFKHWFSLSCWLALPHLFGIVSMVLFLLFADTHQIGSEELQLLSLNELFFHRKIGEPGFALLSNLTLLHPWAWALGVLAIRLWSGRSWPFSALFALLPAIVLYGVWIVLAFR